MAHKIGGRTLFEVLLDALQPDMERQVRLHGAGWLVEIPGLATVILEMRKAMGPQAFGSVMSKVAGVTNLTEIDRLRDWAGHDRNRIKALQIFDELTNELGPSLRRWGAGVTEAELDEMIRRAPTIRLFDWVRGKLGIGGNMRSKPIVDKTKGSAYHPDCVYAPPLQIQNPERKGPRMMQDPNLTRPPFEQLKVQGIDLHGPCCENLYAEEQKGTGAVSGGKSLAALISELGLEPGQNGDRLYAWYDKLEPKDREFVDEACQSGGLNAETAKVILAVTDPDQTKENQRRLRLLRGLVPRTLLQRWIERMTMTEKPTTEQDEDGAPKSKLDQWLDRGAALDEIMARLEQARSWFGRRQFSREECETFEAWLDSLSGEQVIQLGARFNQRRIRVVDVSRLFQEEVHSVRWWAELDWVADHGNTVASTGDDPGNPPAATGEEV